MLKVPEEDAPDAAEDANAETNEDHSVGATDSRIPGMVFTS